jgi:hypothetical protein
MEAIFKICSELQAHSHSPTIVLTVSKELQNFQTLTKNAEVPGHANEDTIHHLPGKMHQFCVPQQGCQNLGSVGYVLFDNEEKLCKPDPHTGKLQCYEQDL